MPSETRALARDVIDDVRNACQQSGRKTTEGEVRRALEPLSAKEVDAVRRLARGGLTAALGPDALVDVVRGTPVHVANAREIAGYYALKAEHDALVTLTGSRDDDDSDIDDETDSDDWDASDDVDDESDFDDYDDEELDDDELAARWSDPEADAMAADDEYPGEAVEHDDETAETSSSHYDEDASEDDEYEEVVVEKPKRAKRRGPLSAAEKEESQVLMTLFAYHRDAVRVAQEMGIGLQGLSERIEELNLRRSIHRLLEQTTDIDVFSPAQVTSNKASPGSPEPLVRKRGARTTPPPVDVPTPPVFEPSEPAAQTDPVNAHGTRVYRRTSEHAPPRRQAAVDLAVRREYVREPRRRTQLPATKPSVAVKTARPSEPEKPSLPPFTELQGKSGRPILEKLLADEKANPRVLAKKLAERFEGPANREVNESDLRALLKAHGLAERFVELETANTRFMLGFHQGARGKLANALLMTLQELDAYLARLGLGEELERLRAERSRLELGKKRLHDRISQVLTRAPYLDDLGVLPVIDREVEEQLAELFRTHKGDAERVREALGLEANPFAKLLRRYDSL